MWARVSSSLLPPAQCLWASLIHLVLTRALGWEVQEPLFALPWSQIPALPGKLALRINGGITSCFILPSGATH